MKILKNFLSSIIILIFSSFSFSQEKTEDRILTCKNLYKKGEYVDSIKCFSELIPLIKDEGLLVEARINLAYVYFTVNDQKNAEEQIKNCLKLMPSLTLKEEEFVPPFIDLFNNIKLSCVGILFLRSKPSNATAIIDGIIVGKTPIRKEFFAGKKKVKLLKTGFLPKEEILEIIPGQENEIIMDFRTGRNKNYNWKNLIFSIILWGGLTFLII